MKQKKKRGKVYVEIEKLSLFRLNLNAKFAVIVYRQLSLFFFCPLCLYLE